MFTLSEHLISPLVFIEVHVVLSFVSPYCLIARYLYFLLLVADTSEHYAFCMTVKSKDGKDYEPNTIRGIACSIDRYIKLKHLWVPTHHEWGIFESKWRNKNQTKTSKKRREMRFTRRAGAITDDDVNTLYNTKQLGNSDPDSIF